MSSYRAIAGVSASLRTLLLDRMDLQNPGGTPIPVTIAPPDVTVNTITGRRLNLYLYQITENAYLKNQEIPGQGHPSAYGHPPLSLDLHYLLTAYGSSETAETGDLEAQEILGDAMRVLHDFAIVTDRLTITQATVGTVGAPLLDPSLLGEFEKVKITLKPLSLDDLTKIWTALPENNFRRSVAYEVSVIQIESQTPRRTVLPVRERRVYALPFRSPQIQDVFRIPVSGVNNSRLEVGETLRIQGVNLAGSSILVRLGDQTVPALTTSDAQIDAIVPNTLAAGVQAVQVIHELPLATLPGQPPMPHRVFSSNLLAFQLLPRLVDITPATAGAGDTVTVEVNPPVRAAQEVLLLLGDFAIPAMPVSHDTPPRTDVEFRLPEDADAISAGTYFCRIRVSGAESRLTTDPTTGAYTGPTYTVTA